MLLLPRFKTSPEKQAAAVSFHATRRRIDCVLFRRLHSRIPAVLIEILWNCQSELFCAGWVAAVTGREVKKQRCSTLQHSNNTGDIFIDSNKGQMTQAESKIKKTHREKQRIVSATVRTCFSDNIISQHRITNAVTPRILWLGFSGSLIEVTFIQVATWHIFAITIPEKRVNNFGEMPVLVVLLLIKKLHLLEYYPTRTNIKVKPYSQKEKHKRSHTGSLMGTTGLKVQILRYNHVKGNCLSGNIIGSFRQQSTNLKDHGEKKKKTFKENDHLFLRSRPDPGNGFTSEWTLKIRSFNQMWD